MNSSMPVDIQRANTAAWREEFLDLRFPEFRMSGPVDEENETLALLPGNIVMFPEFDFSIALIAGFHRSGVLCIIPISPHSAPAMEFELRLSDSAFVLQTWNTRFIRKKDIPQIIPVEKLGQDDFELALKHSRFTFEGEKFFSENIGQSLNLFDPEDEVLERYVDQQYQMFPECSVRKPRRPRFIPSMGIP